MTEAGAGTACYLYCLTPATTAGVAVPGAGVCECGDFAAVFSEVRLADFCGEEAEARQQDLAWLAPRVLSHEAVIEAVMREGPVLPAPFATLFSDAASLRRFVLEHQQAIGGFLNGLGDRREWAVKGLFKSAESRLQAPSGALPEPSSPGLRYFEQKRSQLQFERDSKARLREFCARAAGTLGALSSASRERRCPAAADPGAEVLFNWAFLLSPSSLTAFRAAVDALNGEGPVAGLALVLTGPWPPYSFAPALPRASGT